MWIVDLFNSSDIIASRLFPPAAHGNISHYWPLI